jgi:hypothetical protein
MAHELDPDEIVDFREFVMTNIYHKWTRCTGYSGDKGFTEAEFLTKLKEVQTYT